MKALSCICLAAGRSTRMRGDHKLLKKLGPLTLIERVAAQLCELSFQEIVFVVGSGGDAQAIEELLGRYPVTIVTNLQSAEGMHTSIKAGIESLNPEATGALICLADQPFHLKLRLRTLISGGLLTPSSLVRSTVDGTPGHPVFIGRDYFPRILQHADGDHGCAYLFKEFPSMEVPQHASALWDLDTPEDFARFKEAGEGRFL